MEDFNPSKFTSVTDMLEALGYEIKQSESAFKKVASDSIPFTDIVNHTPQSFWDKYQDKITNVIKDVPNMYGFMGSPVMVLKDEDLTATMLEIAEQMFDIEFEIMEV